MAGDGEGGGEFAGGGVAGVVDAFEEEAGGRGRPRGGLAGVGFEEASEVGNGELAAAGLDDGADDSAYHLPEEVAGADAEEDEGAGGGEFGRRDFNDGGGLAGRVVGEGAEVVAAREQTAGRKPAPPPLETASQPRRSPGQAFP